MTLYARVVDGIVEELLDWTHPEPIDESFHLDIGEWIDSTGHNPPPTPYCSWDGTAFGPPPQPPPLITP